MNPAPQFIQGVFSFEGRGFDSPLPLNPPAAYKVPRDKRAQPIHVRGGRSRVQLIMIGVLPYGNYNRNIH